MIRRWIIYPLEAILVAIAYGGLAILPVDAASAFGAWLGRTIGPRLRAHRVALENLARILPERSDAERREIVRGMWDNLGRTMGEHPHIDKFDPYADNSRIELVGVEHLNALYEDDKPGLLFAGHLANWELSPLAATKRGWKIHLAYRALNNPLADQILLRGRGALGAELFPKGSEGARMAMKALANGEHLAMLVDQKMNDGIEAPFMDVNAMTAPALAQFALRYDCPVVPVRVERLKGAHFQITFFPPLAHPDTGDRQQDLVAMMTEANRYLGDWIRERPEQWLWVHRRWPAGG